VWHLGGSVGRPLTINIIADLATIRLIATIIWTIGLTIAFKTQRNTGSIFAFKWGGRADDSQWRHGSGASRGGGGTSSGSLVDLNMMKTLWHICISERMMQCSSDDGLMIAVEFGVWRSPNAPYLPQFSSSELSWQSVRLLQRAVALTHWPLLQRNWLGRHCTSPPQSSSSDWSLQSTFPSQWADPETQSPLLQRNWSP